MNDFSFTGVALVEFIISLKFTFGVALVCNSSIFFGLEFKFINMFTVGF